jgi:hypothetical protein
MKRRDFIIFIGEHLHGRLRRARSMPLRRGGLPC